MYPNTGHVSAAEAYKGTLHHKTKQYAENRNLPWVILSAKHGFLRPEDVVPKNYDIGFHFPASQVITAAELAQQWKKLKLDCFREIVLLAGKKHTKVLLPLIGDEQTLLQPLQGSRGIGDMLKKLNEV
ncbi:DUF6884 domain-containing protein [Alteribacillus sp. HJP-4]|uniref:DUF6884 domain-containing protein n=1 Tax=Alteribacillus sp. HJP-4 TaxID=2775394 RepID=UPI0035CCE51B